MKKCALFLLLFLAMSFSCLAQNKDSILGKWLSSSGDGQVEIYKRGNKYFGKLVWLKVPNENGKPKLDVKNPVEGLRNRPKLGLEILKDFDFDGEKWTNGTIYDPKTGKTYSCNMSLKQQDQLNIRGYIGISLIGRSEIWTKVK